MDDAHRHPVASRSCAVNGHVCAGRIMHRLCSATFRSMVATSNKRDQGDSGRSTDDGEASEEAQLELEADSVAVAAEEELDSQGERSGRDRSKDQREGVRV